MGAEQPDTADAQGTDLGSDPLQTHPVSWGAEKLGVAEDWYKRQLRDRKLPGHKIGRGWRLTEADVQAALDATYKPAIIPPPDPSGLSPRSRTYLERGRLKRR